MAEIHNLKELNKLGRDLKKGDQIYFTTKDNIIKYNVWGKFLYNYNFTQSDGNALIFDDLGLNNVDKYKLAEKCYKYKSPERTPYPKNWPEYKRDDFHALERLVREIYKMLGDNSVKIHEEDFILSRFEILDL